MKSLVKQTFGFSSPLLWTLAFGALATGLAVMGPVSFVRRFLRAWGLWTTSPLGGGPVDNGRYVAEPPERMSR